MEPTPHPINSLTSVSRPVTAAAAAMAGDPATAETHRKQALAANAGFTVEGYLGTLHYKRPEDSEHHREALLRAGLPQ